MPDVYGDCNVRIEQVPRVHGNGLHVVLPERILLEEETKMRLGLGNESSLELYARGGLWKGIEEEEEVLGLKVGVGRIGAETRREISTGLVLDVVE